MNTKHVYFIRHGESISNVENVVQGLDDPLSPEGERQILRIAERMQNVSFEQLYTSDAVRARETALAIAGETKHIPQESALFREVRRPSSLVGMRSDTPEYRAFEEFQKEYRDDPTAHFEDEENFFDAQKRAQEALDFLRTRECETLCVVTHGHFLRFLFGCMVYGDSMSREMWDPLGRALGVTNTGVTLASYGVHPIFKEQRELWRIITWNDHAHFAE